MGKSRTKQSRSPQREETQLRKLQRKYDEAKHEIKRLKNIIKRTNPERLREMLEIEHRKRENLELEEQLPKKPKKQDGPRCPKCQGFKLQDITFTRADGTFRIIMCKADHCGHRSPPQKVIETESISSCENNDSSEMED